MFSQGFEKVCVGFLGLCHGFEEENRAQGLKDCGVWESTLAEIYVQNLVSGLGADECGVVQVEGGAIVAGARQ